MTTESTQFGNVSDVDLLSKLIGVRESRRFVNAGMKGSHVAV